MSCGGEIFGQCFTRIEKYPLNLCCSHIARSPCCASFTSDATTSGPLLARSFKASTSNQSPFKSNIRYCRRRWGIARKIENQSLAKQNWCFETISCSPGPSRQAQATSHPSSQDIVSKVGLFAGEDGGLEEKIENQSFAKKICVSKQYLASLVLQSKHQKSLFLASSNVIHKVIEGAKAEKWTLLEKLERKHWSSK